MDDSAPVEPESPPAGLRVRELLNHWRHVPVVDAGALRADIDTAIDPAL